MNFWCCDQLNWRVAWGSAWTESHHEHRAWLANHRAFDVGSAGKLVDIPWVMAAQALSGIAKDLNKMSAKSAIKTLVPENAQGALFKWIAILTGQRMP